MKLSYSGKINTNDIRTLKSVACRQPLSHKVAPYQTPVGPCTNWVTVNTDASIQVDASVPGNINVATHPQLNLLNSGHAGTIVLVRLCYPTGVPTATAIKVFGFDGAYFENNKQSESEILTGNIDPKPELLADADGNLEIVLTPDLINDPADADGFSYTQAVSIDYHGNFRLLFPAVQPGGQGKVEAKII